MNYWRIEIWKKDEDSQPRVEKDILKKLKKREYFVYASLEDKMLQYVNSPLEDVMATKELEKMSGEQNMWELKFHLLNNEIRFLGCLTLENDSSVYYALYGFKKKDQKVKSREKLVARGRIEEFKYYFKENGLQRIL